MLVPVNLCKTAAKRIAGEVSSILEKKYNLYSSFDDDLDELQNDMTAISAVLHDAEKKQEQKNSLVEDWLRKLRDALLDAEDLLDDINAEVLRQNVEAEWRTVTWVRNFFFRSNMDDRIKKLVRRIHRIVKLRKNLNLRFYDSPIAPSRQRDLSHSYLSCREVIGRENDAKNVMERLLSGNYFVVPIVGIGGLGKTSLVQLVFDDDVVKGSFDLRLWINVSDDLNEERIQQKKFIKAVDSSDNNVDVKDYLSDTVKEKKFLLVLDDVWDFDGLQWDGLKKLLGKGARGSRVLMTARTKVSASILGEKCLYQLGTLDNGVCMSLFARWAFGEGESTDYPNLVEIGEEIVIKCGGVPLALRTLGGLLSVSKEESYWKAVKNSDKWGMSHVGKKEEGIMSVLKLSYDQLPSDLKECFAYCSILPKGLEFNKQDLILLWMAQGFVQLSGPDQQLEDVGNWYVNEFVSRYIFDVVHENHKTEIVKCRMHDLFHDLAKLVAGNLMVNNTSDTSTNRETWKTGCTLLSSGNFNL